MAKAKENLNYLEELVAQLGHNGPQKDYLHGFQTSIKLLQPLRM